MFDLSENLQFSVHGGGDSGGMAGLLGSLLTAIENWLSLSPGEMFAALLPGIAAMENIHPLFVHFPIAFLSVFFLIDLAGSVAKKSDWRRVASWFLYLGAIFAGLTMTAGLIAAASVLHGDDVHEIMETHEHIGITIFTLASALSVWRLVGWASLQGAANYLYLIFAGLMCILLVFAADLGGLMVYKHGVAVEAARSVHINGISEHQHNHEDDHDHDHAHSH
jgi:uncharacterized membrane protein